MVIVEHRTELQTREIVGLRKAIGALTEQRKRKKNYIRTEESLTVGDVHELRVEKNGAGGKVAKQLVTRVDAQRHCRRCGKTGQIVSMLTR
jgi:hypothetical protein